AADGIAAAGLDGGKMMVRVADEPEALRTLASCAHAIDELSARKLPAMVEVFASELDAGRVRNRADADSLIRAIAIVSGLGTTSAYLWLKLPVVDDLERVMRATSLPTLLLGGDPGEDQAETFGSWKRAMAIPQVRGLVAGRTLLYPRVRNRLSTMACTSSIGPGATNMVTGAALATINRLPVLLLPGDVFAARAVDPVLQQLEVPWRGDATVNDAFKPVSRFWDRIT